MALASCPARQGQQRSLRKMRQALSWALARSPGPRNWAWARLAPFCEVGSFRPRYGMITGFPVPVQPLIQYGRIRQCSAGAPSQRLRRSFCGQRSTAAFLARAGLLGVWLQLNVPGSRSVLARAWHVRQTGSRSIRMVNGAEAIALPIAASH
jgi:hypothetical protein